MKKIKLFFCVAILVATFSFNVFNSKSTPIDIAMENVEAVANSESSIYCYGSGSLKCSGSGSYAYIFM